MNLRRRHKARMARSDVLYQRRYRREVAESLARERYMRRMGLYLEFVPADDARAFTAYDDVTDNDPAPLMPLIKGEIGAFEGVRIIQSARLTAKSVRR